MAFLPCNHLTCALHSKESAACRTQLRTSLASRMEPYPGGGFTERRKNGFVRAGLRLLLFVCLSTHSCRTEDQNNLLAGQKRRKVLSCSCLTDRQSSRIVFTLVDDPACLFLKDCNRLLLLQQGIRDRRVADATRKLLLLIIKRLQTNSR